VFDLEAFYGRMRLGEDPYEGQTYDEWLAANPIPEKWLARLERDEAEMEAAQRMVPAPATRRAVERSISRSVSGGVAAAGSKSKVERKGSAPRSGAGGRGGGGGGR
jgi:hypothetical protein